MIITTDVTLEVELHGTHDAGLRSVRRADGTWEPGEGPSIVDMRVWLVNGNKRLDITAMLSHDKLRDLEEDGLELSALNG